MAENAAGVGPPSAVSRLIKCREPVNPPSAPTVVKVTDTSKTSVSLEWTTPVFDGGMEIIGYVIEMCKADLGEWHKVNAETCIATKYTVTDLEAGEHYKFRVSAVNGAGKGESCEVPATIQATDRLSSPEIDIDANFKQTHIVRAGATIRLFIAFLGKPVPTATWSKADSDLSLRADIHITDSFSTLTVENCNRNDAGKYVFTVENVSGSKSIAFTVKVLDTPGPPGPITFKDVTRGSITLMWDAPVLDGVTGYLLEMKQKGSDYWVEAGHTKQLTFTVEGLLENNEYEFRVKAKNDAGYSEPREAFSSVIIKEPQIEPTADLSGITRQLITCKAGSTFTIDIPITIPSQPGAPEAVGIGKEHIIIQWLQPESDGGSEISNYLVDKREKRSLRWTRVNRDYTVYDTRLKVTGLMEHSEYQFRVTAVNAAGNSEPSDASQSILCKEPSCK
uniref:Titin n=1 Tax=Chrysemys picta bellii TaxID=8478 RepID=A0A8C3F539_CHRPI